MPFGPKRGYSDKVERRQIENLREAAIFADTVEHPLNLSIDINWTRTWPGDDPDGQILDRLMELGRKWLKHRGVAVFAWIEVRESPTRPYPCSNAHILLHCPRGLIASFEAWFHEAAVVICRPEEKAIQFRSVGNGNPTLNAVLGKLKYLSKGTSPRVAKRLGIRPEPQGRVYGKRVSVSQGINRTARQRYDLAKVTPPHDGITLQPKLQGCNPNLQGLHPAGAFYVDNSAGHQPQTCQVTSAKLDRG